MQASLIQIQNYPGGLSAKNTSFEVPSFHLVRGNPDVLLEIATSSLFAVPDGFDAGRAHMSARRAIKKVEVPPEPNAISLNLAQACNMSCSYCYADEGRFGGKPRLMGREVALGAIDRLVNGNDRGRISVGFIGGEPLLNRDLLHYAAQYAAERASRKGLALSLGITTNGTLLEKSDIALFRKLGFAVTVSIDGGQATNDAARHSRSGSAYQQLLDRVGELLRDPGRARLAARSTITRTDLRIAERVEALASAGFPEIGVSPLRTSRTGGLALEEGDWLPLLREMCRAGELEWGRVRDGGGFRFSNLSVALKQLHQGACRPLPCGAAVSYVSVNAEGDYFTCHRTIDQADFALGSLVSGPEAGKRERFARSRMVDSQQPCASCWARYLCGGGCHAEVLASGRSGCDYVRGWLEFAIGLYPSVLSLRPDLLHS
jgi:uncharacterized protein